MHGQETHATTRRLLPARRGRTPSGPTARPGRRAPVHDLRDEARDGGAGTRELRFPAGDVLVASGLPGSGKSTLINRTVPLLDETGSVVIRVDSQNTREAWERRLPGWLPYALYRPLVRYTHYAGLRRALRSNVSVVVHDCGALPWVRRWLARDVRRRGRSLHMVLLDVDGAVALEGQAARGRGVSGYAFGRHLRAMRGLITGIEEGRPPEGCASAVLLDRSTASALRCISFE
ncbi:AAA family ATPase [Streptomyces samsunensis]|uniref:AAA family ATPase n=1 Tax=Streptomyces TaxID=1883 RepID=UPI0015815729|nr:AAA family ATPase [Streptomyces sp. 8ZJF_21]MCM3807680.1 AAA family ATPase [Streptomyces sp. DR7-3]NUH36638.1 AAA family ATPase [Streptomyces samsunensis]